MRNFGDLQRMAKEMQTKMQQVQEELARTMVTGTAGGGAVTIEMTGAQEVKAVRIDPAVISVDWTVDGMTTVGDAEIVDAMAFLFDRLKLVVEPSGAVGVAALLNGRVSGSRIGVILSGGNVGLERFRELLAR